MALATQFHRGDIVPHLVVRSLAGSVWDYSATTWQRRNLLLVALPAQAEVADAIYVDQLLMHVADFQRFETTWVLTRDAVPGLPSPGLLVADRWGEIYMIVSAPRVTELPRAADVLECLRYVEHECPECQGEAK